MALKKDFQGVRGIKHVLAIETFIYEDKCRTASKLNQIGALCADLPVSFDCSYIPTANGDHMLTTSSNITLIRKMLHRLSHKQQDGLQHSIERLPGLGTVIEADEEAGCVKTADLLNEWLSDLHPNPLVGLDGCNRLTTTTTTTITTTTITTTTTTTTITTTTTTPFPINLVCLPQQHPDTTINATGYRLAFLSVVPCRNQYGTGMLTLLDALFEDCIGSGFVTNTQCRKEISLHNGAEYVVLDDDGGLEHVYTVADKLSESLLLESTFDKCKCNDEVVYGMGGADCKSYQSSKPFCYTDPGTCGDEMKLALNTKLTYSHSACDLQQWDGHIVAQTESGCNEAATLLNAVLEGRRSGLIEGCRAVSSTPTSTATTTETTTTATTTTTPSTTATPHAGCPPGFFYDAENSVVCQRCAYSTYQDATAPHYETSCKTCRSCKDVVLGVIAVGGQFTAQRCQAESNTVCKTCSTCGADEYFVSACGAYKDTLCRKRDRCDKGRCAFDATSRVCYSTHSPVPCSLHAVEDCPREGGKCTIQRQGGLGVCIRKVSTFPSTIHTIDCERLDRDECLFQSGFLRCSWDIGQSSCRNKECADIYSEDVCLKSPHSCKFDTAAHTCHGTSASVPCYRLHSQGLCTSRKHAQRCMYSAQYGMCGPRSANEPATPCRVFAGKWLKACPTTQHCTRDPNAHGHVCQEKGHSTACVFHNTASACPGAGVSREEYSKYATNVSNSICRAVQSTTSTSQSTSTTTSSSTSTTSTIVCNASQYIAIDHVTQAPTCRTTRACTPPSTFQAVPASRTSDRICNKTTTCVVGHEYESRVANATSDRSCAALVVCSAGEYTAVNATASSDRVCANATCPAGTFRLAEKPVHPDHCKLWQAPCQQNVTFQTAAPTATSDRICKDITAPCSTSTEYEDVSPTPTTDRVCRACDVCEEGLRVEQPCTARRNTVCQACSCQPHFRITTACSGDTSAVCSPCTRCDVGLYRSGGCAGAQDSSCSRCSGCLDGAEYAAATCNNTHDVICKKLVTCTADEFEARAPTRTSQRLCTAVRPQCSETEFVARPPNKTVDRVCQPLTACNATACTQSSWYAVQPYLAEEPKTWVWVPNDNINERCGSGSGSGGGSDSNDGGDGDDGDDEEGPLDCVDFPTDPAFEQVPGNASFDRVCGCPSDTCDPGTYQAAAPMPKSDRNCTACPAGKFQNQPGASSCMATSTCAANEYESAEPTVSTNRECRALTQACDVADGFYEMVAATITSDRLCSIATTCEEGKEFEAVAPNATSDRTCTALSKCGTAKDKEEGEGDLEYEAQAPTPTSDRVCKAISVCNPSIQWQCSAPTASVDRGCCTVDPCPRGQYLATNHTETVDRVCAPHTACKNGEFQAAAGTAIHDRVCRKMTQCTDLEPRSYTKLRATATSDAVCQAATVCPPGTYQKRSSTDDTDTHCQLCDGIAEYQDQAGQSRCAKVAACESGEYRSTKPTAATAGICAPITPCGKGEYVSKPAEPQDTEDQVCSTCTACGDGQYTSKDCTETTDTACRATTSCKTGWYEVAGPTLTTDRECSRHSQCGSLQFVERTGNATHDTQCRAHRDCQAGSRQVASGTGVNDRLCDNCTDGRSFTVGANMMQCSTCSQRCPLGQYIAAPCAQSSDIECKRCPPGQHGIDGIVCSVWSECTAGEFEERGPTGLGDRICRACPQGTFQPVPLTMRMCKRFSACVRGIATSGTPTSDRVCSRANATSSNQLGITSVPAATTATPWVRVSGPTGGVGEGSDALEEEEDTEGYILYAAVAVVAIIIVLVASSKMRTEEKGAADLTLVAPPPPPRYEQPNQGDKGATPDAGGVTDADGGNKEQTILGPYKPRPGATHIHMAK